MSMTFYKFLLRISNFLFKKISKRKTARAAWLKRNSFNEEFRQTIKTFLLKSFASDCLTAKLYPTVLF